MNSYSRHASWRGKLNAAKVVLLIIILGFSMYQISFWFLGWMPNDWGKLDDGEWITLRKSFSTIFAIYGGLFLAEGIAGGISATVEADKFKAERILWNEIDDASSVRELQKLRKHFDLYSTRDFVAHNHPTNGYIQQIDNISLSSSEQRQLFLEAAQKIDRRLNQLALSNEDNEDIDEAEDEEFDD